MTDIGQGVDFSPLKTPDYVGGYQNAFQVGRALAGRVSANALRPGRAAGPARANAPGPVLSPTDRADIWATMAEGLRGRPYAERPAVLAHLSPVLARQGFPVEAVRAFDPTDENLDGFAAAVRDAAARSIAGEANGGEPTQEGEGNKHAEQPRGDGVNVAEAEILRQAQ